MDNEWLLRLGLLANATSAVLLTPELIGRAQIRRAEVLIAAAISELRSVGREDLLGFFRLGLFMTVIPLVSFGFLIDEFRKNPAPIPFLDVVWLGFLVLIASTFLLMAMVSLDGALGVSARLIVGTGRLRALLLKTGLGLLVFGLVAQLASTL